MEKKRFTCKNCHRRGNHLCEERSVVIRGRWVRRFFARCPHCFCSGEVSYKKPMRNI